MMPYVCEFGMQGNYHEWNLRVVVEYLEKEI